MSMSRKHFNRFAAEVRQLVDETDSTLRASGICDENDDVNRDSMIGYKAGLRHAARVFADLAQADNGRFDRERFMRACGF